MRKWILNTHLYASLLCAPYLMIFGISSLEFNHHFAFAHPKETRTEWDGTLVVPPTTNDLQTAEWARDSLGMLGWPLPWDMHHETNGNLRFAMEQPGKSYKINLLVRENRAHVEERRKGVWPVINALHGLTGVPNSPFASAWGFYTDLCTWTVLFAGVSGIYLWASSRRERLMGLLSLLGGCAAGAAFILYVVIQG